MTYTFKLSRRLAQLWHNAAVATSFLTLSCTADGGQLGLPPDPTSIALSPGSTWVGVRQTIQFDAVTDVPGTPPLWWYATGGTVDISGKYTAGQATGRYLVIAAALNGVADTAVLTIIAAAQIVTTPTSVELQPGATRQFTASAQMSDSSSSPIAVTWSASGGTISSTGLYTAGQTAGSYRAIATQPGGTIADTSAIAITAPNTPPPAPPPFQGLPILPGESIQAAVNANSAGTAFLIKAGRHVRQSVVPKKGNRFRCETGAIMDGENVTASAFQITAAFPYPDSVHIVGCRVTRYNPPFQYAAIRGSGDTKAISATGWVVDSNEVDNSSQVGIRIGNRMKVRFNNVHDNGTFGISGLGDSVLVEQNQITANGDPAHVLESGGTKFVRTHGLIVRGNTVRRNNGPGLWADIANDGFLFENNTVEDQYNEGIAIEISYGGKIRNNTIRRNGLDDPRAAAWPWGAGITIAASGGLGIEIYGNLLEGNAHGIALIQQARGTNHPDPAGVDPEMYVQNINIHDNRVTLQTVPGHLWPGSLGATLGVDDTGRPNNLYSGRNITIDRNTYILNGTAFPFAWNNGYRTSAQWQAYGHDSNSSFAP